MTAAACRRCKQPLACTLEPGEIGLHPRCLRPAFAPPEPTFRLVGLRPDGKREPVAAGLSETAAAWERRRWRDNAARGYHRGYAAFVVEPEE